MSYLATPSIRVVRYLSTDNNNVQDYRRQMEYLAREIKASAPVVECGCHLCNYGRLDGTALKCEASREASMRYESAEEQLVNLACAWGDVTHDELQKFVEEA